MWFFFFFYVKQNDFFTFCNNWTLCYYEKNFSLFQEKRIELIMLNILQMKTWLEKL